MGGRVRPHLSPWLLRYRDDGEKGRGWRLTMERSLARRLRKHVLSLQRQLVEFRVCRDKLVCLGGRLVLDVREVNWFVRFLFPAVRAALVTAVTATVAAVVKTTHH